MRISEIRSQGAVKGQRGLEVQGSRKRNEAGKAGRGMSDIAGTRYCFAFPSQMCSELQSLVMGQQGLHPVSSLVRN